MGVIVNESIETNFGVVLPSYYAAVADNRIEITNHMMYKMVDGQNTSTKSYHIMSSLGIWVSKEVRDEHKPPISTKYVVVESSTPFTENVYDAIYTKFKESITDYTDDL